LILPFAALFRLLSLSVLFATFFSVDLFFLLLGFVCYLVLYAVWFYMLAGSVYFLVPFATVSVYQLPGFVCILVLSATCLFRCLLQSAAWFCVLPEYVILDDFNSTPGTLYPRYSVTPGRVLPQV
jgi:hypothetical protein